MIFFPLTLRFFLLFFSLTRFRVSPPTSSSLRTVSDADHIIVLHAGAVAEQGTHDELLAKEGLYADLWSASLDPAAAAEEVEARGEKDGTGS